MLQHIYDTCNSINLSSMPNFGRYEKILLHQWDRKNMFPERIEARTGVDDDAVELSSISSHHASAEGKKSRKGSESSSYVNAKDDKKGAKADNKNFETSMVFRKISMPLKVPTYLFDEDVGEVSETQRDSALKVVFRHRAGQRVQRSSSFRRAISPSLAYQWRGHASHYPHHQRHSREQAGALPRLWWIAYRRKDGPRRELDRLGRRSGTARYRRHGLPLRQSREH